MTETEKAFAADRGLQLTTVRNDLTNWGGENEKWVKSASQWYIVKQDGGLFRWDGRRGASGARITTLARKYYNDTSLLVNAASAGTREVEAALDDVFVDLPDSLSVGTVAGGFSSLIGTSLPSESRRVSHLPPGLAAN